MSNEYNEQIKERCYEQAEWEVLSIKAGWFNNPDKFWENMIEEKAKELYNNWRSND